MDPFYLFFSENECFYDRTDYLCKLNSIYGYSVQQILTWRLDYTLNDDLPSLSPLFSSRGTPFPPPSFFTFPVFRAHRPWVDKVLIFQPYFLEYENISYSDV